ncbi:arylamine N-acetyltransferase [Hymenobacter sp. BT730]|uniref:arylamine N-acetyltransferase family protein n=1 Tax=Hymenobacter sp. BT730 TaxID=3063332 RepID=UPI0026E08FD4|nr:arylamine N-acetyltransferase [Hymenobacter sp. BT730]
MNTAAYLARIGVAAAMPPSLAALQALQQAHLLAVPFENLDIHLGRRIDLANTFDKIVTHRRGGFCYELNGLFCELLQALGYEVKQVSARVYDSKNQTYSPEYDHLALVVTLEKEDYLVDVGFGDFAQQPLQLQLRQPQQDARGQFRISCLDADYLVVEHLTPDGWVPEYMFSLTPRCLAEFAPMCHYHQTSPASHFTQKSVCSLLTPDGRITLTGQTLKITRNGIATEYVLADEQAYHSALLEHFGITL